MIDTIVLVLNEHMFSIFEHHKFSPSTEGLFNPDSYYRLGGRSNFTCVQNPTPMELKNRIYKPRLTITKRLNKLHQFEITLKIEFSAPKLLFGNNFDELDDTDFPKLIEVLKEKLKEMGIYIFEERLINAPVSAIHYSKNIPLTDYSTPYTYLERLLKVNLNQHLDLNQTDFRNGGNSVKFHANSFEIAFYDKLKDLKQAGISEKRAEEKDNAIQLDLFSKVEIKKPFEVLRVEIRLNKKQKLMQILGAVGITDKPTLKLLFSKTTARKVLLHYFDEIEKGYPRILDYNCTEPKRFLADFSMANPNIKLKKLLEAFGLRMLLGNVGIRELREIIQRYGKQSWYKLNKELKQLNYPSPSSPFALLRANIAEFKSIKLVDFQNPMINNVNVS